jgi:hypothetical protein
MAAVAATGVTPERRHAPRSNLFLTATLQSGATTAPVRIRNLSNCGALIDGRVLPLAGDAVRLVRGSLSAEGQLEWRDGERGGICFAGEIDVQRWLKGIGHGGQQRVDTVLAAIRRAEPVAAELIAQASKPSLAAISTALDQLCERIAGLPNMSVALGEELVRLDAIAQSLRSLTVGSERQD